MDANKLIDWVQQNAVIDIDSEHACITVDFSNSITEWFNPMELAYFVAELFPFRDWMSIGVSPGEDDFQVELWWCSDEYVEACQQDGNDEDELPLTPEGRAKLAELVKGCEQCAVAWNAGNEEWEIDRSDRSSDPAPSELKEGFYLYLYRGLSWFFGEDALGKFIAEQFPDYSYGGDYSWATDDTDCVLLVHKHSVKNAA